MQIQTIIPEARTYGVAIAAVLACTPFSIAWHLFLRWFRWRGTPFVRVYGAVLLGVTAWGALIFGRGIAPLPAPDDARAWLASVALGLIAGIAAAWCDRAVVRFLRRSARLRERSAATQRRRIVQVRPVGGLTHARRDDPFEKTRSARGPFSLQEEMSPGAVVFLGAMEEVVYRGILVQLCGLLVNPRLVAMALALSVVLFGLSHIEFGWPHVISKLPLGALALAAVLGTGFIVPALIAHVLFNVLVYRNHRASTVTR